MAPKTWLLVLLLLPVLLGAQSLNDDYMFPGDEAWEEPTYPVLTKPEFNLGGLLGNILVDNKWYSQLRLRPEVAIWKVGIGMDIDLLFDGEGKLRRKGCDLLVVNAVGDGKAFGTEDNTGWLLSSDGSETALPLGSKSLMASRILDEVRALVSDD